MRERAMAAIALLAVGAFLAGCTGTSGVNTQELTTATGSTTHLRQPRRPSIAHRRSQISASHEPISTAAPSVGIAGTDSGLSAQESADRAAIEAQWNKFWQVYLALPHTPEATARLWPPRWQSTPPCPTC